MGNNCISKLVPKGVLNTFSRYTPQKKLNKENEAIGNDKEKNLHSSRKDLEDVQQIIVTPPEPVKIGRRESKLLRQQSSRIRVHPIESDMPVQLMSQNEQQKQEKPNHVRRVSSHGLQVDSVLKRKTRNLKDFYTIGRKLGHGQFGTTFLCVEKVTRDQFACKSIAKRKLVSKDDVEDVRREIEIMHHLKGHPNVISIKEEFEDAMAVYVVMELCAGGELFDRIVKRGQYSERKAVDLARTIISVVETCHSLGVMHRDLKPENFLFINEEEDSPLKTIDFGLSIFFRPGDVFTDVVGSPYYVPPEVLLKQYGPEADIWSAGVIFYILLSGVPPFWGETEAEIFDEVLNGELDFTADPWPNISKDAKDLIHKMLARDPKERLTAHEGLCHPWIMANGLAPDKPLDPTILSRLKKFSSMNKLKKMALRVIAERLSDEEIAGLKEMFKMMDIDNNGHITSEELKEGLKKFGASLEESEIQNLLQAADVNNSGTIDYGDFIAAMLHQNKLDKEDHLLAAFSFFDKDGSGYITRDELQQACQQFGIDETHLEDVIKEVDQDNDGRIDYNEFVDMMQIGNVDLGRKQMHNFIMEVEEVVEVA